MKEIEIPFGAFDSETIGLTYTIPEGFTVKIEDGKIIVEKQESDDEKIRKELIDFIQWAEDRGRTRHDYHQAKRPAVWIAYLENQKEQKPVQIHIDNPNIQKVDPDIIVTRSDSSTDGKELLYVSNKSYQIGFRDGVASVKPTEWSEEDEEMKESIIDYLESKQVYAHSRTNMIVWLKSLRPQPHWKPSEEQMKELDVVARGFSSSSAELLESLYNDLKKLM